MRLAPRASQAINADCMCPMHCGRWHACDVAGSMGGQWAVGAVVAVHATGTAQRSSIRCEGQCRSCCAV